MDVLFKQIAPRYFRPDRAAIGRGSLQSAVLTTEYPGGRPNRAIAVKVKLRRFFLPFDESSRLIGHRKTHVDIVRLNRVRDGNNRSR